MSLPLVPIETQIAVNARIRECLAIAHARGMKLLRPLVRYDLKGTTSGMALWPENQIRLNPVLLIANKDKYLATTVPHEVAHLIVSHRYGGAAKPHGTEWQTTMEMLGAPVRRTHTYDVTEVKSKPRQTRRTPYHCRCTTHQLTPQRVSNMKKGVVYSCKNCFTRLIKGELPLLKKPS